MEMRKFCAKYWLKGGNLKRSSLSALLIKTFTVPLQLLFLPNLLCISEVFIHCIFLLLKLHIFLHFLPFSIVFLVSMFYLD